jgi:transcriptional regulator with XRE-family HTH domain
MDKLQGISEVTKRVRADAGLTLREFAPKLVEQVPNKSLSFQAVGFWEQGKYAPDVTFLMTVAATYGDGDWRRGWALECLHVLLPSVYSLRGKGMVVERVSV